MKPYDQGDVSAHDGTRLHWIRWIPQGEVRGLVWVVHGLGEHGGRYDLLARVATDWGFVVFAADHRGHGLSQGPRAFVSRFGELFDDLEIVRAVAVEGLPADTRRIVWGHSMGGLITLRALQRDPTIADAAVISAPWIADAVTPPWWKELPARVLNRVAPRLRLTAGLGPEALTRDPDRIEAWRADGLVQTNITPRLYFEARAAQRETWKCAGALPMPVLFLVPMDDALVSASESLRFAGSVGPGPVRVERLEATRHEPHNDVGRAAVFEYVRSWIEELPI